MLHKKRSDSFRGCVSECETQNFKHRSILYLVNDAANKVSKSK